MSVDVDGRLIDVHVRVSSRAKKMRIMIGPLRPPEVVVPARTSRDTLRRFLDETRDWIGREVARAEAVANQPSSLGLDMPGVVWLAGRPIRVQRELAGRASARLTTVNLLIVSGPSARHGAAIERWYRRAARRRLTQTVQDEARRLGLTWASIGVRDPRTRWGSCSHSGHLSFSWRLVLAPTAVLRYVAIHELCHLVEHNHSKAFWKTLDTAEANWREFAQWLREHGHELHRYEPARALLPFVSDDAPSTARTDPCSTRR